jgi:hypothetical protein
MYCVLNTRALSSKQGSEKATAYSSQAQRKTRCGADRTPDSCNGLFQKKGNGTYFQVQVE